MALDAFDLSGKVALITGGNSGIGLGMAKGLAESGADVCIWGTNIEKNERSQKELSAIGIKAHAIKCDVSSEDQVETAFEETVKIFGKVDSCFANAGAGGGGRLVGTSSTSAIHGAARNEAYASTKGAMLAMIRGLSVEMARYGITANSIIPGWIETAMTSARVGDERFEDRVMKRVPVRRWGTPEDFAGIAVYLASDASGYQTGEEFVIDGGYTRF